MERIKPFILRPRYYETDRMGIIHHSNYIRWMEEARIDFLEQVGLPYDKMEETGIMIPVLGVECQYKSSARYGDTVEIRLSIQEFNGFRLKIGYVIHNAVTNDICATAASEHCFTDSDLRPLRTKKAAPEIYEMFSRCTGVELY